MVRLGWALLWTMLVLYPDPRHLAASLWRAAQPALDPALVSSLADALPDDPAAIETYVHDELLPYAVPWQTYGVPWYFPTARTALTRGEGDCQARAVVLASILQAKGIPATLMGSFDHLWVDYPGKARTAEEKPEAAILAQAPNGTYRLQWPHSMDWRRSWEIERGYFWDAMPPERFLQLVVGITAIAAHPRRGRRIHG